MKKEHEFRLQKNFAEVCERIDCRCTTLPSLLLQEGVLLARDVEKLSTCQTTYEANKELLLTLPRRGDKAYSAFITALEASHPDISDLIQKIIDTRIDPKEFGDWTEKMVLYQDNETLGQAKPYQKSSTISSPSQKDDSLINEQERPLCFSVSPEGGVLLEMGLPPVMNSLKPKLNDESMKCFSELKRHNTHPIPKSRFDSGTWDADVSYFKKIYERESKKEFQDVQGARKFVHLAMLNPNTNDCFDAYGKELLKFACGCLNSGKQGTIYFGFKHDQVKGVLMIKSKQVQTKLCMKQKRLIKDGFPAAATIHLATLYSAIHDPILVPIGPPELSRFIIYVNIVSPTNFQTMISPLPKLYVRLPMLEISYGNAQAFGIEEVINPENVVGPHDQLLQLRSDTDNYVNIGLLSTSDTAELKESNLNVFSSEIPAISNLDNLHDDIPASNGYTYINNTTYKILPHLSQSGDAFCHDINIDQLNIDCNDGDNEVVKHKSKNVIGAIKGWFSKNDSTKPKIRGIEREKKDSKLNAKKKKK